MLKRNRKWFLGLGVLLMSAILLSDELISSESKGDSNGIGLNNVIARLDLHYNTDNIVSIYSEGENKGTEVVIRIPIH